MLVLRNNKARILSRQILKLVACRAPRRAQDLHSVVIWEWERFILAGPGCANKVEQTFLKDLFQADMW